MRNLLFLVLAICLIASLLPVTRAGAVTRSDGTTLDELSQQFAREMDTYHEKSTALDKAVKGLRGTLDAIKRQKKKARTPEEGAVWESREAKAEALLVAKIYELCEFRARKICHIAPVIDKLEKEVQGLERTPDNTVLVDPDVRRELNDMVTTLAFLAELGSERTRNNVGGMLSSFDQHMKKASESMFPLDQWKRELRSQRRTLNRVYAESQANLRTLDKMRRQLVIRAKMVKLDLTINQVKQSGIEGDDFDEAIGDIDCDTTSLSRGDDDSEAGRSGHESLRRFKKHGLSSLQ